MTILIFDENLLWSSRLKSGVEGTGNTAVVIDRMPLEPISADIAIVNLASRAMPAETLIPLLKTQNIKVVAHAGHKEKPLLLVGQDSGADLVVTNGELTNKLAEILGRLG